jgi:hypothetical protein
MLQFIYAKEIIYNETADKEEERDAYFNAFEILQFRPINEADLSRGVVVDFKNGESRMYKCDLIDFGKALEQAKIKAYATLINQTNGDNNNRKRKPKSTSQAKVSK